MKPAALLPVALGRVASGSWSCEVIPPDTEALFFGLDWQVISLDLRQSPDLADGLKRLGAAADFPDYYGANLDAAFDCLTDLAPARRVFVVRGSLDFRLAEVLADAIVAADPRPTVLLTDADSKHLRLPTIP